jgi:hypothetical protein
MERFYKLARPDGYDFHTGRTINYREHIGKLAIPPTPDSKAVLCSKGLIHASRNINDCFIGAKIPCSAYIVEGIPSVCDEQKCGFIALNVIAELTDLDSAFGWRYSEAASPTNPLDIHTIMTDRHKELLKEWASVRDSVWDSVRNSVGDSVRNSVGDSVRDSVRNSVRNSVGDSVRDSVWDSVGDSVRDSVWDSVRNSARNSVMDSVWDSVRDSVRNSVRNSVWDSVWDSVRDSVWAYVGYLFSPIISEWKYIDHAEGTYPYQSAVDLWKDGFIPSFDGKIVRLHAGKKADIIYEVECISWPMARRNNVNKTLL